MVRKMSATEAEMENNARERQKKRKGIDERVERDGELWPPLALVFTVPDYCSVFSFFSPDSLRRETREIKQFEERRQQKLKRQQTVRKIIPISLDCLLLRAPAVTHL